MTFQIFHLEKHGDKYEIKHLDNLYNSDHPCADASKQCIDSDQPICSNTKSPINNDNKNIIPTKVKQKTISTQPHKKKAVSLNSFLKLNSSKNIFKTEFYYYIKHLEKADKHNVGILLLTNKKPILNNVIKEKLKSIYHILNKKQISLLSKQAHKFLGL